MGDSQNPSNPPTELLLLLLSPPQPAPVLRSNMPFLYYGLVVVATAAVVLAVYNLIIVRWCATEYQGSRESNHQYRRNNNMLSQPPIGSASSFRYKKGVEDAAECSVCLSVYEEGEEVRKLPRCKHSFHAECIDMWLFSHLDCPLCRAPVMLSP